MNHDGIIMAPVFGLWHDTDECMPVAGECVLGCGWTEEHIPIVVLMSWEEGEDGEPVWMVWGRDRESPPPWCWCEVRFIQPLCEVPDDDDSDEDFADCNCNPELN